jgi:predicted NUDIX family NTP pyrophosphohydrolase
MSASKQSAGILLYRSPAKNIEVLIVHPGGPFWAKKDAGAWSIPKGEVLEGEDDLLAVAKREFQEETGQPVSDGECHELGTVQNKSGKVIHGWAVQGDLDATAITSNTFTMEWPPKSGKEQEFPEVDRAAWFAPEKALKKLNPAQVAFVERLVDLLGVDVSKPPEQTSLL